MMKRMSRYTGASKLLVLLLCALLLAGTLPSFSALGAKKKNTGSGSLKVSLKTSTKELPAGANVEFTLYKIGTLAPKTAAGWTYRPELASYIKDIIEAKTDSKLREATDKLAKHFADKKDIADKYKVASKTLSKGSAEFDGLEDGLYLGMLTKAPKGLTANASLFTIPKKNPKTSKLEYNIDITVKDEFTPTAKPSATPTPTRTPTTPPDDDNPPPGGGGVPAPTPVPTTEISGTKVWVDDGNAHKVRPGSIQITLLADDSPVNATPSWSKNGDRWTYTFSGLPKVDSSGSEISYTVEETPVNFYESSVSGLTITNKLIPKEPSEYIDLSGQKTWRDNNNDSGKRPTAIMVRLLRDGEVVESRSVTAGTGWSYTFQDLPVDDGYGHTYTYEIREDGVPGYFNRIEGTNVVNTLIDGSVPPPPNGNGETPPPDGTTPNVPQTPQDVPERHTGTPIPHFEDFADEELEELFDMFGYGTPLYGMFGTGDQVPAWVWICGGVGILALVMAIIVGRKKKNAK